MSVSSTGGYANIQKINQAMYQMSQVHQSGRQKVQQHMQVVDSKASQASQTVVSTAIETKSATVAAKGNIIDVMA